MGEYLHQAVDWEDETQGVRAVGEKRLRADLKSLETKGGDVRLVFHILRVADEETGKTTVSGAHVLEGKSVEGVLVEAGARIRAKCDNPLRAALLQETLLLQAVGVIVQANR